MNTAETPTSNRSSYWWASMSLLPLTILVLLIAGLNQFSLPWQFSQAWVPSLGIEFSFYIDSLSALMLLLISGIGVMVFIYAAGYLKNDDRRHRIFLILPLFMLSMMGAVSADDVFVLFLFWELTSITSFLLVGYKHESLLARESARQALFITMGGGLALLAGLILLSDMAGTTSLQGIIQAYPDFMHDHRLNAAIVLLLLGAFTKSAQFPFHFWLPNAMSAPTPVSAYLHSATMVKLGIYLMARFDTAFNELFIWEVLLITTGTITAVWAAVLALRERDLKRILARSTISALGTLTLLIGLPSDAVGLAVVTFLVAHAIYKAPLFMVAGNIDHATGTRQIDHLMGLRKVMPFSAAIAILAGLSMAGLPLAFGFVAKDIITLAKEQADVLEIVSFAFLFVNATAVAVAAVAAIRVFWGPLKAELNEVREVNALMIIPPLGLALLGIELELFPDFIDPLLLSAATAISPGLAMTEISATYSLEKLFTATALTASIGLLLFLYWDRLHAKLSRIQWLDRIGPEASYTFLLESLKQVATRHTNLLQSGQLDTYLLMTLSALLVMLSWVLLSFDLPQTLIWNWGEHGWIWLFSGLIIIIGALGAIMLQNRLTTLMSVGLIGYAMAVLFLFSGAPDLAFTQFTVETVLVVIAVALLPFFGKQSLQTPQLTWPVRTLVALIAGAGTFLLLLTMLGAQEHSELKIWFSENALTQANGHNVVNVILVDFRALDTLGEIAVVAFSLLAALPLLKGLYTSEHRHAEGSLFIARAMKPLYILMLFAAAWILLRGHNAPGGGFIGGLTAATASSLVALTQSPQLAIKLLPLRPIKMAMVGLVLALGAGFIGLLTNTVFMAHSGTGIFSTVMLFDVGVFLVVWGSFSGFVIHLLSPVTPLKPLQAEEERQ